MSSFFAKLSGTPKEPKKLNPYLNPHHPGHNPIPNPTSMTTTSADFLAEARKEAGRDPVTGRRRSDNHSRTTSERNSGSERNSLAELRQVEEEERTAYQSRAAQSTQTTGTKYELFVQESLRKREATERLRIARGGVEYYAPERRVEEFYAGGVRD